jgi:hypothetical protein
MTEDRFPFEAVRLELQVNRSFPIVKFLTVNTCVHYQIC